MKAKQMNKVKFDEILVLDGQELNHNYIGTLNKEQRENLIEPIFNLIREQITEFPYPDDLNQIKKEFKRLQETQIDLNSNELYNNSSVATIICKFFCHSFYTSREIKSKTMEEVFFDNNLLKKTIKNRLGLEWIDEIGSELECFSFSPKMIAFQAPRSQRLSAPTSIFKPAVAKYLTLKYSNPGDTIYDYSAGFGGRMLGAMSVPDRKYTGTDPMTVPELKEMVKFFDFNNVKLIHSGSENYREEENSVDFSFSSPPYVNKDFKIQEYYSNDKSQAYNNGEKYFYDIYWKQTLDNIKYMLKPGKIFGLNIKDCPKMLEMAKDKFGEEFEIVKLRTVRSHLIKTHNTQSIEKFESIYIFKNEK